MLQTTIDPGRSGVVILIGPPGAGKTTFAEKWLSGVNRISPDDLRKFYTGDISDMSQDSVVWRCVYADVENSIKLGMSCYVDATAANGPSRRDLLSFIRSWDVGTVIGIWLTTPLEVCLDRNLTRDRVVDNFVINRMFRQLREDPPTKAEGFDVLMKVSV